MDTRQGKLIVLEGIDGSGKGTQTALLTKRIGESGRNVASISFPQYDSGASWLVKEYLRGKYGGEDISPYAASVLFAVDRFDASFLIRQRLEEGCVVLLDRYVDSNAGHQGGKISDPEERKRFLAWLYDFEYRILGVPKPDIVVILKIDARVSQENVGKKGGRGYLEEGKTHDIHEADTSHLEKAQDSYLWLARKHPENHAIIECMEDGALLPPEKVHEMIWNHIQPTLLG